MRCQGVKDPKMGKNFSYPVSEKFTTSDNDDESLLSEEFSNDLSE